MPTIRLPYEWQPRPYQRAAWEYLEAGGKRAVVVAHRRWGKDEVALHWAAVAAHERVGSYWHMLPQYAQARKAIWSAVNPLTGRRRIDDAFPPALRAATNEQEMLIRLRCGSTWQVIGSDNYQSLVGTPPVGIVFSEFARADPAAWAYLAPILAENNGWAIFVSTPLGRNHLHQLYEMARSTDGWHAELQTVDDTGAIAPEIVEQQRREYVSLFGAEAGEALIEQEYYCSFAAAIIGAYWGKELAAAEREGRIARLDRVPDCPVHTAWDIGVDDPMAIWVYQVGPGWLHVIDYYESSGHGFEHYVAWLRERGYVGGIDWVPHDAKIRDPSAPDIVYWRDGARVTEARTRIQHLVELGRAPRLVPAHKLMDGINAGRRTLAHAKFDGERCARGLAALREYRAEWDAEARTFRERPAHDWASHAADAWRYLSMGWLSAAPPAEARPAVMRGIESVTADELLRLHRIDRRRSARI